MLWDIQVGESKPSQVEATALDNEGKTELTMGEATRSVSLTVPYPHRIEVEEDGRRHKLFAVRRGEELWVWHLGRARLVRPVSKRRSDSASKQGPTVVTPPMPAVVVKVRVEVGQQVKKGEALVVVSAMKMEMTLTAPYDGTVSAIHTEAGAKVSPGQVLVDIQPE